MHYNRRTALAQMASISSFVLLTACGGDSENSVANLNLAQAIKADPRLSTLGAALDAASLTDTVASAPALTIMAPTNDAFSLLLRELGLSKESLFSNSALLGAVLKYHVLPNSASISVVSKLAGKAFSPLDGGIFKVDIPDGRNFIIQDGRNRIATFKEFDKRVNNGVIHVIDTVLLPANKTIVQTATDAPQFSILVEALKTAELVTALQAPGPLTVFAPTNTAFTNLLTELGTTKEALFKNTALLKQVLLYHVVGQRTLKADIPLNVPMTTLGLNTFAVSNKTSASGLSSLFISDARRRLANISATDVLCSNGVIHVLDKVILPPA